MYKSTALQIVNFIFNFTPLTKWYKLRAFLLRLSGIDCSKTVRIISSARIVTTNIVIGEDTFIGHQALITGSHKHPIRIGNNVDIAPRVIILSGSHLIDMEGLHSAGFGTGGTVIIEDGVWVGANTTIVPGVTIGKKAIIGAGSVVVKNIPAFCIAVGNPCRPIKIWDENSKTFIPL